MVERLERDVTDVARKWVPDARLGVFEVAVEPERLNGCTTSRDALAALRRIAAEPKRWRKIPGDNRKLNFHRFPYAIVYSLRADAIYVRAVMHLRRRPFYWRGRV